METTYITCLIKYLKFVISTLSVASVSQCNKVQCCLRGQKKGTSGSTDGFARTASYTCQYTVDGSNRSDN